MKDFGKFHVITDKPIALDSPDYLKPFGTQRDNSQRFEFNLRLEKLLNGEGLSVTVLDLGCAGGGMVKSFLDMGHLAIGIEGSDFSLKAQRAEWATIPDYLFTADITAPFMIVQDGDDEWQHIFFTTVTAWDVLEHIKESDLPAVWDNVNRHLYPGGYFICSICTYFEMRDLPHHQNIKPWDWWVGQLAGAGLVYDAKATKSFQGQFVRTNSPGVFRKAID